MNKVGAKRLLKLARFLRTVPRKAFDFAHIMELGERKPLDALRAGGGCGTAGCAIGWSPAVFPKQLTWDSDVNGHHIGDRMVVRVKGKPYGGWSSDKHLFDFFGIEDSGEWDSLFTPYSPNCKLRSDSTPKQVALNIERAVYRHHPSLRAVNK